MYILGINAYHGDSAACLLKDGVVVCATEEERFRRIKHWAGFPKEAIKFCLEDQGISLDQVDYITISRNPKANFYKKLAYVFSNPSQFSFVLDRLINTSRINSIQDELSSLFNISSSLLKSKIFNIEHHRSHIASSFFASPFKHAAILSIDGFGDFTSTMTAVGNGNQFDVLGEINYPHSLGVFYTTLTQFLGFSNYGDEYKVMGLAPYGNPVFIKDLEKLLLTKNGFFKLNRSYFRHFSEGINMNWKEGKPVIGINFSDSLVDLIGKPRKEDDSIEQWHIDLACSVQKITEDVIFYILNSLHKKTGLDNLCVTGGVAQNSVVNGKILARTPFKNIYIPSAANDSGTSIGSALYLYNHILRKPRCEAIKSASFGKEYSEEYVRSLLDEKGILYKMLSDKELFNIVVDKLLDAGVVGWFQGRAEFGSRALGNRSILVDPRRADAKDLLNKKIKRRETFRPFAPSILKEYISEYFLQEDNAYFMEKVFEIKEEKRDKIPAVTHVDGTGRLHSVDSSISPRYYQLIRTFYNRTNVPILLNTSFNENEPIVNSPEEAIECFLRTKMDLLVIGNIIIERSND